MQRILRLSLVVAVIISCSWQAREAHSADSATKLPIEVPLQSDGGMPTIEVMVNGKGPFIFGIDTGAQGGSRIDSSLMEKLALKPSGQVPATDGSGRNPQMSELVKLESIEIGGLRFSDVTAGSRNYRKSPRPLNVDGILGLSVFSEYLVTLDLPAKVLRIEKGELPKADGAEILDYKSKGGIPLLELTVGTAKIDAHLDTGNAIGAFVLPTALAEKLSRASEPVVVGRARSASGEMEIKQVRVKDLIRLGRHEFPDATVTYPALSDVGNVGVKTLSQFVITFDQKNERVRLKR
jgi:predicted aspartyl protease